ncbi:hypothetical protein [Fluviispira sanaruensis]|uniref:Uncharacterized protein n=1 Tax=Fluviispira sanaruensis TaxID=2493639 RepID=A0A4P2VMG9_FLUSA|nr:hypothetical protein [Fluviispira sanaruensis]BBH53958.1 hypothetical protein JCM31447_24110 [Fluviispira sanaruensis]
MPTLKYLFIQYFARIIAIKKGKEKLIFCFSILTLHSFSVRANEISANIPERVYRSTPSKPDKVFSQGFQRSRNEHTDLSRHINGETQDASGLISTTSSIQYAFDYAESYAMGWWRVSEFFVYEIIPDENFVSVSNTYYRTLRNETESAARTQLVEQQYTFTREDEYSALFTIPPERVIAATRFEFDRALRRFTQRERIINTITRENEHSPQLQAAIHPNTYSLGTLGNRQFTYNGISSGFACVEHTQSSSFSMRKKRSAIKNRICPLTQLQVLEALEEPEKFLTRKSLKIAASVDGYTYCLTTYENYIYLDYKCKTPQKWNYTEFGQFISEINDGKNQQYYCMTAPQDDSAEDYARMQICDLNNDKQIWKIKKTENGNSLIFSSNGYVLSSYKEYAYLRKNFKENMAIKLMNASMLKEKQANALIQFSVDPLQIKDKYILYPTSNGNAYLEVASSLVNYTNYYNAHNNALFSSYGNKNAGPQVCYFSSLLREGGTSWGWVKDEYCSTKGKMKNELRWIFGKNAVTHNAYSLYDIADNILRIDDITGSKNRYYAYTAFKYWPDSDSFVEFFNLTDIPKLYADTYNSSDLFNPSKEQRLSYAFSVIKEKYKTKIHKLLD